MIRTIQIQRAGDDHSTAWHFDIEEQGDIAVKHCEEFGARIISQTWQGDGARDVIRSRGDFITGADELRAWLAFDYLENDDNV